LDGEVGGAPRARHRKEEEVFREIGEKKKTQPSPSAFPKEEKGKNSSFVEKGRRNRKRGGKRIYTYKKKKKNKKNKEIRKRRNTFRRSYIQAPETGRSRQVF